MTDNRTNEPTDAMVLAAAKAIHELRHPDCGCGEYNMQELRASRAALVAAQGAAPQAESDDFPTPGKRLTPEFRADIVEAARDRIQAVWADVPEGVDALTLAQNIVAAQEFFWLSLHFPVLPSSGVNEALRFCTCSHWLEAHHERKCLEHHCACENFQPVLQVDEDALAEVIDVAQRRWNGSGRKEPIATAITRAVLKHLRGDTNEHD